MNCMCYWRPAQRKSIELLPGCIETIFFAVLINRSTLHLHEHFQMFILAVVLDSD